MRVKLVSLLLAGWLFWQMSRFVPSNWEFWHDKRWQKSAKWSAGEWIVNFAVFYVAAGYFGHGLAIILAQSLVTDGVNYFISREKIWPDRRVSPASSGGFSLALAIFCFAYHKAAAILLVAVFGLGAIPVKFALAGIGVLENPVRYHFNNNLAFAETRTDMA